MRRSLKDVLMNNFLFQTPANPSQTDNDAVLIGLRVPTLRPLNVGLQQFVRQASLADVVEEWLKWFPDAIATIYTEYPERGEEENTLTLLIHSKALKTDVFLGEVFPADEKTAGDGI